jgi:hypothetical protein
MEQPHEKDKARNPAVSNSVSSMQLGFAGSFDEMNELDARDAASHQPEEHLRILRNDCGISTWRNFRDRRISRFTSGHMDILIPEFKRLLLLLNKHQAPGKKALSS